MNETLFLGHTPEFWLELEQRAINENRVSDINEIAELRAKVSFYESRIKDMNRMMDLKAGSIRF